MTLINALVSHPDNLAMRISLRKELLDLGVKKILQVFCEIL